MPEKSDMALLINKEGWEHGSGPFVIYIHRDLYDNPGIETIFITRWDYTVILLKAG